MRQRLPQLQGARLVAARRAVASEKVKGKREIRKGAYDEGPTEEALCQTRSHAGAVAAGRGRAGQLQKRFYLGACQRDLHGHLYDGRMLTQRRKKGKRNLITLLSCL